MSFEALEAAIETRLEMQWEDKTSVAYNKHVAEPPLGAPSIRLTIAMGGGENISIGAPGTNLVRYAGAIMIQIFVPDSTAAAAREIARLTDHLRPVFQNWFDGGLRVGTMRDPMDMAEPPFWLRTVSFPYTYDQHHG